MCRFYPSKTGNYVRLCYVTGRRGERIPIAEAITNFEGTVRAHRWHQTIRLGRARPPSVVALKAGYHDACVRCGQPRGTYSVDAECGDCAHRERLSDRNRTAPQVPMPTT